MKRNKKRVFGADLLFKNMIFISFKIKRPLEIRRLYASSLWVILITILMIGKSSLCSCKRTLKLTIMKRNLFLSASCLVLAWFALASCTKEFKEPVTPPSPSEDIAATDAYAWFSHPGRTLAANCFQCHGTDGFAGELKIAGESYSELMSELNELRLEDPKKEIMSFHAQAYTADEIRLIADYFSKQKK